MSHTTAQLNAKQNIYEICYAEKSQYKNRHFILSGKHFQDSNKRCR